MYKFQTTMFYGIAFKICLLLGNVMCKSGEKKIFFLCQTSGVIFHYAIEPLGTADNSRLRKERGTIRKIRIVHLSFLLFLLYILICGLHFHLPFQNICHTSHVNAYFSFPVLIYRLAIILRVRLKHNLIKYQI